MSSINPDGNDPNSAAGRRSGGDQTLERIHEISRGVACPRKSELKTLFYQAAGCSQELRQVGQEKYQGPFWEVYIAEVDGEVVAYALIFIMTLPPIPRLRRLGYISDMYVKEKYRSLGIASKLYEEATKWFRRKGIKHLSLIVLKGNDLAHSIYEKWGFFDNFVEMRKRI